MQRYSLCKGLSSLFPIKHVKQHITNPKIKKIRGAFTKEAPLII